MTSKQEMYDRLFPAIYLKMVEQFLPNLEAPPEDQSFSEDDLDRLGDLAGQARVIADIGAHCHAQGLFEDEGKPSDN